eukprot:COSAG02_NODE_3701_length_6363_cov_4.841475_5_plen_217_part_00
MHEVVAVMLNLPAAHSMQLSAFVTVPLVNFPAWHVAQAAPPSLYVPGGQLLYGQASADVVPPLSVPNLPVVHSWHWLADVAPVTVLNFPGGHLSQIGPPLALYRPAGQMLQCVAPSTTPIPSTSEPELVAKRPASQLRQAAEVVCAQSTPKRPSLHPVHPAAELIPVIVPYVPAGHSPSQLASLATLYRPAGHALQCVAAVMTPVPSLSSAATVVK